MQPNASAGTISKGLFTHLHLSLGHAALNCCPSMNASQIDKDVGQRILLRFTSFTMLWSLWTRFTFKCPSQRHWSSSAPYFLMIVSNRPYPLYAPCWSSFRTNCHYVVLLKSPLHHDLSQYIHLGWVSLSTHSTKNFSLKANLLATWTYGGGHPWYKFLDFIFHHHLNNNKTHYDCFHNAIITDHIGIMCSNYLIYISNAVLHEVIWFDAPEFMIHLHITFECGPCCVASA